MSPEEIAAALRVSIRNKTLSPGDTLVQEELAKNFGVSRNPVREALRMLVSEGLVEMTAGMGATVRMMDLDDLVELYDMRIALEPIFAQSIIEQIRRKDLDSLTKIAQNIEATSDIQKWVALNFEFHSNLYQLGATDRARDILNSLLSAVQPYTLEHIEKLGGKSQASQEHFFMIDAIGNNDSAKLGNLFVQHLSAAKARLIQAYSGN
jgi:DNA-binding GntR family transcriptional regulator